MKVYRFPEGGEVHDFKGHRQMVHGFDYSPDGRTLASGSFFSSNPRLILRDAASGREIWKTAEHDNSIVMVRFTRDGQRLISSDLDKNLHVRDPRTGEITDGYRLNIALSTFEVDPTDTYVVGGGYDGGLVYRRIEDGTVTRDIKAHSRVVSDIAFSADGRYLATSSYDQTIKVWRAADGAPELLLTLHLESTPFSVAFLPGAEGEYELYSSEAFGRIKRWRLELDLDRMYSRACAPAVRDFLRNNPNVAEDERDLCNP